eukprot:GHVH01004892.1.p1 GENE.GHVH01004892.1~~GHVH01004892.1.p1  ORF type:complete len:1022 (+),score=189.18 GHVH01004892.1:26-3091(+)
MSDSAKKRPPTEQHDVIAEEIAKKVKVDGYVSPTMEELLLIPVESKPVGDLVHEAYGGAINCVHRCVRNRADVIVNPKPYPTKPAKVYPYVLDEFQKRAILCLENNESVLIAAHTSAGKTTVAEYAIGMSFRDDESVIYTSPIKALSNQKFRDLQEQFGEENVGLLTGDVSLNINARLMVMTTEILRSMLYRGSELTRQVKWVVFDEVHYMNDRERGVVWEETMILLPDSVRYVFLSATVPNSDEMAEWICTIKHQPCHTIYTDYRPVPLQHYIHAQGNELFLVFDAQKKFHTSSFQQAILSMESKQAVAGRKKEAGKSKDLEEVISYAHKRNLTPMIVFQFSKRATEDNAHGLPPELNFTSEEEKKTIRLIFDSALSTLSEGDKSLPQVSGILGLLERGIGIHHGGLLPLVKELVELLFGEGLLKVLFATETFAMGVNMPARTVIFAEIKKFDGEQQRLLGGGEYIQMSGRAGRRNKDDQGMVIMMMDERMEPEDAKEVFTGAPNRLESQFRLTYSMLLNVLRLTDENVKPQWIIKRSFKQFQVNREADILEAKMRLLQSEYLQLPPIPFCDKEDEDEMLDEATDYYGLVENVKKDRKAVRLAILDARISDEYLVPGRMVDIASFDGPEKHYGLAVITDRVRFAAGSGASSTFDLNLTLLLGVKDSSAYTPSPGEIPDIGYYEPAADLNPEHYIQVRCNYRMVSQICTVTTNVSSTDFQDPSRVTKFAKTMIKLHNGHLNYVTLKDCSSHNLISQSNAAKLMDKLKESEKEASAHRLHHHESASSLVKWLETKKSKRVEFSSVKKKISELRSNILEEELSARLRVLQDLEYIDTCGILTTKGRIACNISTADELVVTEMLLNGHFSDMTPSEACAVLTALLFDESKQGQDKDEVIMNPRVAEFYETLKSVASEVTAISVKARMPEEVCKKICEAVDPMLVDFTYEWATGERPFNELIEQYGEKKKLYEGTIVRVVRRLEELLRQLAAASKSMDNDQVFDIFVQGIKRIKKGIIFSASLYL